MLSEDLLCVIAESLTASQTKKVAAVLLRIVSCIRWGRCIYPLWLSGLQFKCLELLNFSDFFKAIVLYAIINI